MEKPSEKMRCVLFILNYRQSLILFQHVESIDVDDVDWVDQDKEDSHMSVRLVSRRVVQGRQKLGQVDIDNEFLVCVQPMVG